jgi:hypothetical protein
MLILHHSFFLLWIVFNVDVILTASLAIVMRLVGIIGILDDDKGATVVVPIVALLVEASPIWTAAVFVVFVIMEDVGAVAGPGTIEEEVSPAALKEMSDMLEVLVRYVTPCPCSWAALTCAKNRANRSQ